MLPERWRSGISLLNDTEAPNPAAHAFAIAACLAGRGGPAGAWPSLPYCSHPGLAELLFTLGQTLCYSSPARAA